MKTRRDRVFLELNEKNCTIQDGVLTITIPQEMQSMEGIDFYFNRDWIAEKTLLAKSMAISPAPLLCFWNWMLEKAGCPEYYCKLADPVDISVYQTAGIPGAFGFSGYTPDGSDITVKIALDE